MKKSLRPIALVLPGLMATSSFATWTPTWGGQGNGFSSSASVITQGGSESGYTEGKYEGPSLGCTKLTEWVDRGSGFQSSSTTQTGTLVINSSSWSENTYSMGYSAVYQTSNSGNIGWGKVQSDI